MKNLVVKSKCGTTAIYPLFSNSKRHGPVFRRRQEDNLYCSRGGDICVITAVLRALCCLLIGYDHKKEKSEIKINCWAGWATFHYA